MRPTPRTLALAAALALAPACSTGTVVDTLMTFAKRPSIPPGRAMLGYELMAGDFHCHVSPPDSPGHVQRGVAETLELADAEGLDFVVFTPHVRARFYQDEADRRGVLDDRDALVRETEGALATRRAKSPRARPIFAIPGMEYTDFEFGHMGLSFGDLEAALERVSVEASLESPELFFDAFVATGGLVTVNHPFLTPVESPVAITRRDLSYRPWAKPGSPVAPEIGHASELAQAVEAHNLAMSDMRDKLLLGDVQLSQFSTLGTMEDRIRGGRRRIAPVGGSDSHSSHLRAVTFVLAEARTEAAVRDAVLAGRTCVRSPAACALEVRGDDGRFHVVGSSVRARPARAGAHDEVDVRVSSTSDGDVLVDGRVAAWPDRDEVVTIRVPRGRCSLVRLDADGGSSAPVYVGCPFADASPASPAP